MMVMAGFGVFVYFNTEANDELQRKMDSVIGDMNKDTGLLNIFYNLFI
jgi:hypothetical protein